MMIELSNLASPASCQRMTIPDARLHAANLAVAAMKTLPFETGEETQQQLH